MIPSYPSIQDRNTQAQTVAVGKFTGSLDPLKRAKATLDKTWDAVLDFSAALGQTYEFAAIGSIEGIAEDLEIEVRKLEVLSENPEALSKARETLSTNLKFLKKSLEPVANRVPLILRGLPRAMEEACLGDEFKIARVNNETVKVSSNTLLSHAKCGSCLFEALQALDKAKKGEPGSTRVLAESLERGAEALLAHAAFQDAYVQSVEVLGALNRTLDPLKIAAVTFEKVLGTVSHISSGINETYEWGVGDLDMMSRDLEVEVRKLEAFFKDPKGLRKARESLVEALRVSNQSLSFQRWAPWILSKAREALAAASPNEASRIAWFYEETLKVDSTVMVSHAKCRSRLLKALQARDKANQAEPESAEPLAESLQRLAESLLDHTKSRNAFVRSVEKVSETISPISSGINETYGLWNVGELDLMSRELELEVRKLEVLFENPAALRKARESLIGALKVSNEPLESISWAPWIVIKVPGAIEAASPIEAFRITWFYDETLEAESTVVVSCAKWRSCLFGALQARDKVEKGEPGSAEALAESLERIAKALLDHSKCRNAFVRSMQRLALELEESYPIPK